MFVCNSCGYKTLKWTGQCLECKTWNTIEEEQTLTVSKTKPSTVMPLSEVPVNSNNRYSTESEEFNRVLGGGLVEGSVTLISGEPGIGKSTLMLQTIAALTQHGKALYICAEEAPNQISLRASRLGLLSSANENITQSSKQSNQSKINKNLIVCSEYYMERIEHIIKEHSPVCIIVDSIQAVYSENISQNSGKISHMTACTSLCCKWAKEHTISIFIIAHITKEGTIAGPKIIEHLVDTVIMFEKSKHNLRFLYSQKNRHGAIDEVGILKMTEKGLIDIIDSGIFFLEERSEKLPPGVCVAATYEGTRPFLIELQALTVRTYSQNRVFSEKIDSRQVFRIAAVLERHLGLSLSEHNIYINVAGGMKIQETGLELALLLALYSAYKTTPLPSSICAIGEVSLAGEIRSVENFSQRYRQAVEYGFEKIIVPQKNVFHHTNDKKTFAVSTIYQLVDIYKK